jgi:hypothetical protein
MPKKSNVWPADMVDFLYGDLSDRPMMDRESTYRRAENLAVRELAMWDEILECEEADRPKPEWAKQALIDYAKRKYERVKHREQRQILDDYRVFEVVSAYLKQTHKPKRGKAKPFSLRRACQKHLVNLYSASKKTWTAEEEVDITRIMKAKGLTRETAIQKYIQEKISHEEIQTVRRAYERALDRNKKGFYTSRLFLKILSESEKRRLAAG